METRIEYLLQSPLGSLSQNDPIIESRQQSACKIDTPLPPANDSRLPGTREQVDDSLRCLPDVCALLGICRVEAVPFGVLAKGRSEQARVGTNDFYPLVSVFELQTLQESSGGRLARGVVGLKGNGLARRNGKNRDELPL